MNRAQFLRGALRGEPEPIRPPWSLNEAAFVDACTRCGDCLGLCPERILHKGRGGFPTVDFARGECTFCGVCARVCAGGALRDPGDDPSVPWNLVAAIGEGCLTARGVLCSSCADRCETRALRFRKVRAGAVPVPVVDAAACTGCGACFGPCPAGAVSLRPRDPAPLRAHDITCEARP